MEFHTRYDDVLFFFFECEILSCRLKSVLFFHERETLRYFSGCATLCPPPRVFCSYHGAQLYPPLKDDGF